MKDLLEQASDLALGEWRTEEMKTSKLGFTGITRIGGPTRLSEDDCHYPNDFPESDFPESDFPSGG